MTLATFFEHWRITENPFRGEEARQDPVFLRLGEMQGSTHRIGYTSFAPSPLPAGGAGGLAQGGNRDPFIAGRDERAGLVSTVDQPPMPLATLRRTAHSDFEKIAGNFDQPSTAIVFGEKGSGKTAIRMQLEDRIKAYNAEHPTHRCLLVAYDELNPILDRFYERVAGERKTVESGHVAEAFKKFRLVDHIDAILSMIVPRVVNELFNDHHTSERIDLGAEPRRHVRKLDAPVREDLLLLQAIYDRPENTEMRTRRLRRLLRLSRAATAMLMTLAATLGWIAPVGFLVWVLFFSPDSIKGVEGEGNPLVTGVAIALVAIYGIVLGKYLLVDRLGLLRLGHKIRKQIRITLRGDRSFAHSLREVNLRMYDPAALPTTSSDETRYAMLERLKRVLGHFGYASIVVIIDRVDEPTLMSGDPERMQAIIWPLMNNKFLQQPGLGIKMLLPIELRHMLFRESAAFFQEARLDKQNLIERLTWTGAMLYDLCDARLQACRPTDAPPVSLLDLFAEDVTVQDVVDALDQMHQPRDAFKMLYQCFTEHCSNVTEAQGQWRVPRLVLENVRKDQAERVRQLYRGMRPA
ncbi:MAG: hypothetical protein H7210_06225 [Pyrinomonadaceae bacterium]|nr:hypothetical protein [Phycisphaerales bacterium]